MTKSGKTILWLHPIPEHYINRMFDPLESTSDYTYIVAFANTGPGLYSELPVPKIARSLFLTPRRPERPHECRPFEHFHKDWRADLQNIPYDAVFVAGYGGRTQREILRDCHARGIPVAMFSDSNIRGEKGPTLKQRLKRSLKRRLLASKIREADYLLTANSLGVAYWRYYGAPRKKILLCPYYADYDRVDRARQTDRAATLASYDLAPADKTIITAARLVPVKGLHLMIHAFRALNLAARGWKYLIAGTGPLEAELQSLAGDQLGTAIRFIGFQQPTQLMALIHHAHLFAFPSIFEPHGIVVHESLAAETPVLSSDASGAAYDLVIPGQSGFLFRSGEQAALTRALDSATTNEPALLALRPTARAVFEEWFARTNPVTVIDRLAHDMLASHLPLTKTSRP
jgi:glycosyltransferase involved in cell wall biosynthesis